VFVSCLLNYFLWVFSGLRKDTRACKEARVEIEVEWYKSR
jgi:hypothetical protein